MFTSVRSEKFLLDPNGIPVCNLPAYTGPSLAATGTDMAIINYIVNGLQIAITKCKSSEVKNPEVIVITQKVWKMQCTQVTDVILLWYLSAIL